MALKTVEFPVMSHYEQHVFDVDRERAAAQRLLAEREANAVALGEHFIRARALPGKAYAEYVKSLGLIPLTAEGFIKQAKLARGDLGVSAFKPRKKRDPEAEVLKALIELADKAGAEAAIERAKELLNG